MNTAGQVVERYIEDPYGNVTVLNPDGTVRSASAFGWQYLHQGGRLDSVTGWFLFRHRDYSPVLARWVEADPLGYPDGGNRYKAINDNPSRSLDPNGTVVLMWFSYSSGELIIYDTDTGITQVIYGVFSGNGVDKNNPDSQWNAGHGPIPIGTYLVDNPVKTGRNPRHWIGPFGDWEWFPLLGRDGNGKWNKNDIPVKCKNGKPFKRGQFYLHPGNHSNGCVTVPSENSRGNPWYPHSLPYDDLKNLLHNTTPLPLDSDNPNHTFPGVIFVIP